MMVDLTEVEQFVIQEERIDQKIIAERAHKLGSFFGISPNKIKKASQTPAFIVDAQTYIGFAKRIGLAVFQRSLETQYNVIAEDPDEREFAKLQMEVFKDEIEERKATFLTHWSDKSSIPWGAHFDKPDGTSVILLHDKAVGNHLNLQDTLDHEMVHDLASLGFTKGGGFRGPLDTLIQDNSLSEVTTEFLSIAARNPQLSPKAIAVEIYRGRLNSGYINTMLPFLVTLGITDRGINPVTVQDVGNFYFGKNGVGPEKESFNFQRRIIQATPEAQVAQTFRTLFQLSGLGQLVVRQGTKT